MFVSNVKFYNCICSVFVQSSRWIKVLNNTAGQYVNINIYINVFLNFLIK